MRWQLIDNQMTVEVSDLPFDLTVTYRQRNVHQPLTSSFVTLVHMDKTINTNLDRCNIKWKYI